jgi:transcriptional regulator GlxA family with amidase domain
MPFPTCRRSGSSRIFATPGANRPLQDIDHAIALIERSRGTIAIEPLARHVGITRRHLERRFNEEVGLGPKQLSRILRLQAALAVLRRQPQCTGAQVAAQCGYTDQAHLIRECRSLADLPTRLAATTESLGPLLRSRT